MSRELKQVTVQLGQLGNRVELEVSFNIKYKSSPTSFLKSSITSHFSDPSSLEFPLYLVPCMTHHLLPSIVNGFIFKKVYPIFPQLGEIISASYDDRQLIIFKNQSISQRRFSELQISALFRVTASYALVTDSISITWDGNVDSQAPLQTYYIGI